MTKISAEESLRRVNEIAAGNGVMKKHDQLSLLREWRKQAGMKTKTPTSVKGLSNAHGAMGLGIQWQSATKN